MGGLKVRTAICYGFGDYKSPGLIGQTFFTTDFKSVGTPNGGVGRLTGGGTASVVWDAWRGDERHIRRGGKLPILR